MESWQREHIRKNITALIQMTKCNVLLLRGLEEKGVLHFADIETLVSAFGSEFGPIPDSQFSNLSEKYLHFRGLLLHQTENWNNPPNSTTSYKQNSTVSTF